MPTFRRQPVDAVIDVRSTLEFWLGHLPGAIHVPVDRLPGGLASHSAITPDSRLLVYCASGMRSAQAARVLREAGFQRVIDGGGMAAAKAEFSET